MGYLSAWNDQIMATVSAGIDEILDRLKDGDEHEVAYQLRVGRRDLLTATIYQLVEAGTWSKEDVLSEAAEIFDNALRSKRLAKMSEPGGPG